MGHLTSPTVIWILLLYSLRASIRSLLRLIFGNTTSKTSKYLSWVPETFSFRIKFMTLVM